jgi:eukaryotic-like serine/threonine-protein kinase
MATTLTCSTCGQDIRATDRFCARCGAELSVSSHAALLDATHPDDDPESPWAEVVQRLRRATHGEFEIGRELGRGGMAAVFLAHDVALDRKVAIKVMSPGLLMGEGMIERFKREAITIAHLNHPNIVSCFSVRQAEGLHFFVMRYIQGRSLAQVIRDAGRLPIPIVRSILGQVSSALTYAHRSRVVHRDIKPANILIDVDGNAVVTDFGIAKVARLPGHTHTGALVGTPAYMSPEQCAGTEVSGSTDQYSLGAVAYEMITGQAPFSGSTLTVMQSQVESPPPPIRDRSPDCPPDLEAAVLRMLEKDPAQRFPGMAEAKTALGAAPLVEGDPLLAELCRFAATLTDGVAAASPGPAATPITPQRSATRSGLRGSARSITILPPPAELAVGEGFALVALVRGDRGAPLPGRAVEWSTDSPQVLHVDQVRKAATAVAPGTAMLLAACDGVEAQVRVLVPADALDGSEPLPGHRAAAVQISSPPRSVRAGDSFVLTALPLDPGGQALHDAPVLWSSSDVQVAVVTAGGWCAALGRGQAVLTATCGLASGSVTIYVEQAKPATSQRRPAERAAPVRAPAPSPAEETPQRSSWRRRGARTRHRLVNIAALILLAFGSVYLFGGLRDFWAQRDRPAGVADTVPSANAALAAAARPDSIPPINRGTEAAPSKRRPARPAVRPPATAVADPATDSARLGATAEAAKRDAEGRPERAVGSPSVDPEHTVADTVRPVRAPAPSERGVAGYVPMSPGTSEERTAEPQRPPASHVAKPSPAAPAAAHDADEPPVDRRKAESALRDGVEECYRAVRSKDLDRLGRLYAPKTVADEDKLRRLTRILRTEPWQAVVGRRVDGVREIASRSAAAEFSFRLTWRDSYGGRLSSQPIFRAEFAPDRDGWTMSSCRIVGSPKL